MKRFIKKPQPWQTLSHGERTKVMLSLLFSRDNHFLLIDEPTNHLDIGARTLLRDYLCGKRGFLWLKGPDGCGKSTLIKAILQDPSVSISGDLNLASGLKISYINQDTSHVTGRLTDYIRSTISISSPGCSWKS